jgi:hypothetical protein
VDDALVAVPPGEKRDRELRTVRLELGELDLGERIGDSGGGAGCRNVVVSCREREIRSPYAPARRAQPGECLRTRDIVQQVKVGEDKATIVAVNPVRVVDLVDQRGGRLDHPR